MIDKIKNFFVSLASLGAFLYATGYIAEYSHARMLGIPMGQPFNEYYLFSGGAFILSTLYAIYSTIFSHFHYFLVLFIIVVAILQYDAYTRKKNSAKPTKVYVASVFILTLILMFVVIPELTSPFAFSNFLLPYSENGFNIEHLKPITLELKTWILNESKINKQKLIAFYVWLIFSTVISAVLLYSMIQKWKLWKTSESEHINTGTASLRKNLSAFFLKYLHGIPRYGFGLLIILMIIVLIVQIITIPANYGILIKSNHYPEVKVVLSSEANSNGLELFENQDTAKDYKLWLLRESRDELLLYSAFFEKNKNDPAYKLLTLKKNLVIKMEIFDNSFVFKVK